ncbi:MAG: coproporphyrinogen dehydrogenase HemZ, partial [Oscillospiraceae bacterium]|nr:coproporphyrinogen dehydrogenase HemZ [Oscillospiraceae bacterium]
MLLYVLGHPFHYEMENLCRLFFPEEKIRVLRGRESEPVGRQRLVPANAAITRLEQAGDCVRLSAALYCAGKRWMLAKTLQGAAARRSAAQELCLAQQLFVLLRRCTGVTPPWGLLTGVRPSKLMLRLRREKGEPAAMDYFRRVLWVSEEKTALAARVARTEEPVLAKTAPESFSLYVSIPFCPSRCSYCSFVSHTVDRVSAQKLVPIYLEKLCEELRQTAALAARLGLRMESVYVGGGTPTSLSAAQMEQLCACLRESFDWRTCGEFTVEAGRPDTVDAQKLGVLRRAGVNRISINPQSMEDAVLAGVGRRHTAAQTLEAFALARALGFDNINMDLIAGLPGDSVAGFARSLEALLALKPENITVHTLAHKRAAALTRQERTLQGAQMIEGMLAKAAGRLPEAGYQPYYMYRQSRSLGNLENLGWCLPGRECRYNIDMMEESHSVLACGAGAVTKLKAPG